MAEKRVKLNGPERAAILMMALGEDVATAIMKHMGPKEVQRIGEAMATTTNVSRDQVEDVVSNFADTFGSQTALGVGAEDYLRKILVNSLGEDKAAGLIDRILLGRSSKGLEALKWMEPRAIAEVVRLEHPQIIAIVLSYLDPDQAAEVLGLLPENMRADILMRIASLDGIQPSALQELDEILEKQFSGSSGNLKSSSVGGTKTAANILNFMDSALEGSIIDRVKEVDSEMGQKIQDLMFVFDNLADVDDRSIQALLREVSSDTLIIALKEARGPVRLSEVESAQKEILSIARRMAESGDISLGGGGDEFV